METETELKPGYKTSELWLQLPLYLLAAYVIYEGVTPEQITDLFEQVEGQVTTYKEMFNTLLGLLAPSVSTMYYVKKRIGLKQSVANVR